MNIAFFLQNYIDLAWTIPVLAITPARHRFVAAGYVLCCTIMLHLLVELMHSIGFPSGFFPVLDASTWLRGQIVYGLFYLGYMALGYYSAGSERTVFMAASISVFFTASVMALLVMLI